MGAKKEGGPGWTLPLRSCQVIRLFLDYLGCERFTIGFYLQ